jgi:S-DNA-T family DNA segregation ATPase FtsK/SpoIIIE
VDIQLTAVDAGSGRRQDVVLVVEQDSTVADAEQALRSALGIEGAPRLLGLGRYGGPPAAAAPACVWVAGRPVSPELAVRASPLRDGVVVGLGGPVGPGVHDLDVGGVAEVRVVGGPDAGRVHRLPLGEYVLGSAHDADAVVEDPTVSARQARLLVTPAGVQWTPFDQTAGARVEGEPIDAERQLTDGELVAVGDSRLLVVPAEAPDAALAPTDDGGLAYNRPPRLPPPPTATTVELPAEPRDAARRPIPVLACLAPLAFGAVMFLALRNPTFLVFTLLSPVMLISNVISDRRQGRKSYRRQLADYRQALPRRG